jgi:hypothetical protein
MGGSSSAPESLGSALALTFAFTHSGVRLPAVLGADELAGLDLLAAFSRAGLAFGVAAPTASPRLDHRVVAAALAVAAGADDEWGEACSHGLRAPPLATYSRSSERLKRRRVPSR